MKINEMDLDRTTRIRPSAVSEKKTDKVTPYQYFKEKTTCDVFVTVFDSSEDPKCFKIDSFGKDIVSFGRNTDNDIVLSSKLASKHHGQFVKESGVWYIIDSDSTNGLLFNGNDVRSKKIEPGDCIRIDDNVDTVSDGVLFIFTSVAMDDWNKCQFDNSGIVTVGRDKSCSAIIDNSTVSAVQFRITYDGNAFFASDDHSENGILLNGIRLTEKTVLHEKDVINVTSSLVVFTSSGIYYSEYSSEGRRKCSLCGSDQIGKRYDGGFFCKDCGAEVKACAACGSFDFTVTSDDKMICRFCGTVVGEDNSGDDKSGRNDDGEGSAPVAISRSSGNAAADASSASTSEDGEDNVAPERVVVFPASENVADNSASSAPFSAAEHIERSTDDDSGASDADDTNESDGKKKKKFKSIKEWIAYFKYLYTDPINSLPEAEERKKEVMLLLYVSIGVTVASVFAELIPVVGRYLMSFSLVGAVGITFCVILLIVLKKAKEKFKALTCNECLTMAEIKTVEDFQKYVSYKLGANEAVFDGSSHPGSNNGVVSKVEAKGRATVGALIYLQCPHCGHVKTIRYTFDTFKCSAEATHVPAISVDLTMMRLETTVRAVVEDYNNPEKRKYIPYSIHSTKNPLYEKRTSLTAANNSVAYPIYGGVKIYFYKDPEEIVEQFFLENLLDGTVEEA